MLERAIKDAESGQLKPVYLVLGGEATLVDRFIEAVRKSVLGDMAGAGLAEDRFLGRGLDATSLLSTARTLPMLLPRRFILVRHVQEADKTAQTAIANYIADPCDVSVIVFCAEKLAGNSSLKKAAKKAGVLLEIAAPKAREMGDFVRREAERLGHRISPGAASLVAETQGEDLAAVADTLERLSLFVGAGQRIDEDAVSAVVTNVRVDSIWALVDSIGKKDTKTATRAASTLLRDREPALRIMAMVTRQVRMIAKARDALASGATPKEAAKAAGAPPFKAKDLASSAKRFRLDEITRIMDLLAETDLLLKGSQIPDDVALLRAVHALCEPAGQGERIESARQHTRAL